MSHPGPKKNSKAGRKSAYQERADAQLLWDIFTKPISALELHKKMATGKYSIADMFVSKAHAGDAKLITTIINKLFPSADGAKLVEVLSRFGVSGEDEARRLIDTAREAESMGDQERVEVMEHALLEYYTDNPGARDESPLRRLFVTSSTVEVIG